MRFRRNWITTRGIGPADVEQVPAKVLKRKDQSGGDEFKLLLPLYFAVPVAKRHEDKTEPIQPRFRAEGWRRCRMTAV
jgi:hypothetical protein